MARSSASGMYSRATDVDGMNAIATVVVSGRGAPAYMISRAFFQFDTSGISSEVSSATFNVRGRSATGSTCDIIALKANSAAGVLGTGKFSEIEGWDVTSSPVSNTDGSGGGDAESAVTKYSNEFPSGSWTTSGYNSITLNAQALSDIEDNNELIICLMEHTHDLKDITITGQLSNGVRFREYSGTSSDPYIDYTLATTTTATDNAVFFGANF